MFTLDKYEYGVLYSRLEAKGIHRNDIQLIISNSIKDINSIPCLKDRNAMFSYVIKERVDIYARSVDYRARLRRQREEMRKQRNMEVKIEYK